MRLIANSQLYDKHGFGLVVAGQEFDCSPEEAKKLIERGCARKADPPKILYDTKIIRALAPQVSARQPFRDLSVSNEEPEGLATTGDPVLSLANVQAERVADRRGRRRR